MFSTSSTLPSYSNSSSFSSASSSESKDLISIVPSHRAVSPAPSRALENLDFTKNSARIFAYGQGGVVIHPGASLSEEGGDEGEVSLQLKRWNESERRIELTDPTFLLPSLSSGTYNWFPPSGFLRTTGLQICQSQIQRSSKASFPSGSKFSPSHRRGLLHPRRSQRCNVPQGRHGFSVS